MASGCCPQIRPDGSFAGDVLVPSLAIAIGAGLATVPMLTAATAGVTGRDAGLASGLISAAQSLGASLGLAVLVTIATNRTGGALDSMSGSPSRVDLLIVAGRTVHS